MRVVSLGVSLSLAAVCLLPSGYAFGQIVIGTAGEVASVAAQKYEKKLRDAGVRLTPEDVKALKFMEEQREESRKTYRQLAQFANAYEKTNPQRYAQIKKEMGQVKNLQKTLPTEDATVGGYYLEVKRFRENFAKKHQDNITAIRKNLETYAKEVKPVDPLAKPAGAADNVNPKVANLIVDVISVDGDVEFYVNEEKVTKAGQTIKLGGKGELVVRVVAVGKRRKAIREVKPGVATVLAQGDYRWDYELKTEKISLSTLWTDLEEKYTWKVTKQPNLNAELFPGTSEKNPALENDALLIRFSGAFTYGATVSGEVKWKSESNRNGTVSTTDETDKATGNLLFTVRPPG